MIGIFHVTGISGKGGAITEAAKGFIGKLANWAEVLRKHPGVLMKWILPTGSNPKTLWARADVCR
jgi:hypothetical protein